MLIVNAKDLKRATDVLAASVDTGGLEELTYVALFPRKGAAFLWGTDMITFSRIKFPATMTKKLRPLLLPFVDLRQFAGVWDGEIGIEDRDNVARLTCGVDYVDLPLGSNLKEFTERFDVDTKPKGVAKLANLSQCVRLTSPLIATDHAVQGLTGLHLVSDSKTVNFEAADGFRYMIIEEPATIKGKFDVVVSHKAGRLFSMLDGAAKLTVSSNHVHVQTAEGEFSVLQLSADFPDLKETGKQKAGAVVFNVKEMKQMLNKAKLVMYGKKIIELWLTDIIVCKATDDSETREFRGEMTARKLGKGTRKIFLDIRHLSYLLDILATDSCKLILGKTESDPAWFSAEGLTYWMLPFS